MDEHNGDMAELKSLVSEVLEKEGTLAKIKVNKLKMKGSSNI